jgi:hypothetical protein
VDEEQVLALLDEGIVVISGGQIYNLTYMHEFYQNARFDIDSEIHLIIDPYTEATREYLLRSLDGRILLFSSMGENREYNHTVGEYARLFRIYRGQEIHYVLESFDHNEYVLFGHGTGLSNK